ncbi:MAG: GNAT family N-acetyltransferase [Anaerolineaceae bacterium]|nr:MAG: GNAT family N-acetyltransferase [Anaerolineaceae bacterium]
MLNIWRKRKANFDLPTLKLGDMALVPIAQAHAPALFAIVERDRAYLRQWQNWPDNILTLDHMRELINISHSKTRQQSGYDMVIVYSGRVAGKIGVVAINNKAGYHEIGYWLGHGFQGRGLMTRATSLITSHAICQHDAAAVHIRCAAPNLRSRAIPERLGYRLAKIHTQYLWIHGEYYDDTIYVMRRKDWYRRLLYHLTTRDAWRDATERGVYRAPSLDTQGFIHASRWHQVQKVAAALYRGRRDMVLLCIDPLRLRASVRDEPPDPGVPAQHGDGELFPHIYGALNTSAVLKVMAMPAQKDGTFRLPSELTD